MQWWCCWCCKVLCSSGGSVNIWISDINAHGKSLNLKCNTFPLVRMFLHNFTFLILTKKRVKHFDFLKMTNIIVYLKKEMTKITLIFEDMSPGLRNSQSIKCSWLDVSSRRDKRQFDARDDRAERDSQQPESWLEQQFYTVWLSQPSFVWGITIRELYVSAVLDMVRCQTWTNTRAYKNYHLHFS